MSRTRRNRRPKIQLGKEDDYEGGRVRDGTPTHYSSSCEHHGDCPRCEGDRLYSTRRKADAAEASFQELNE